jgi:two-component system, NtrC family, response regulator AtoC
MATATAERDVSRGASSARTIMVVEDDPGMRAVLRDVLTDEGFQVHEEPGPERVAAAVERIRPRAIVLDREMAGSHGIELLVALGRGYPGIPVLVITAFGGAAVRAEAIRAGAAGYLEKPFRMAMLLDTLRAITAARAAAIGAPDA